MDLIYEGITTERFLLSSPKWQVRMDLIYEGITTGPGTTLITEPKTSQNGPDLRRDYDY